MTCHRLIALKEAGAGVATQKKNPAKNLSVPACLIDVAVDSLEMLPCILFLVESHANELEAWAPSAQNILTLHMLYLYINQLSHPPTGFYMHNFYFNALLLQQVFH